MSDGALLRAATLSLAEFERQPTAWLSGVLGGTTFGAQGAATTAMPFPVAEVRARQLQPEGAGAEVWRAGSALGWGQHGTVAWRHDHRLLFGVANLDEAALGSTRHAQAPHPGTPLHWAASRIYGDIFDSLVQAGFPHLMRVWNFIPDINRTTDGTERYQQFNIGRHESFATRGRALTKGVPAATGVGVNSGPLTVHFLATRVEPLPIENPRQMSAYHYPRRYGLRSPTFSRANLTHLDKQEVLFVSGTASIVDHRSIHIGDVAAQTRESLANIAALVTQANRAAQHSRFDVDSLHYRIYVRNVADLLTVRNEVRRTVGAHAPALYLQADICRSELLVEIEAGGGYGLEAF